MKKEVDIIFIKIGPYIRKIASKRKIVLINKNKGRLLDGREVKKINNKWFYIPD